MRSDAEFIRQSIQNAFKVDVSDDFVMQFLAELRTNMRDANKGTRRAIGLTVVLAVVFELANRQAVTEASFFFIKVNSLELILIGIPVLIAYLCYESSAYAVESNNLYWVHRKLVEVRYPSVSEQDVDLFMIPVGDPFGQALRDVRFRRRNQFLTVTAWLRFPILIIVPGIFAIAFEMYAFIQLVGHEDMSIAIVLTAALMTLALLALGTARVATEVPHGGGPWHARRYKERGPRGHQQLD